MSDEDPGPIVKATLSIWALIVSVIYIGGYFAPNIIGRWTGLGTIAYVLILMATVTKLCLDYLHKR